MPVFVLNLNLQQEGEAISIEIPLAGEANVAAIPTIAQHRAGNIVTFSQQPGDVIRLILEAFVVTGPARREDLITNALSVQVQFVQTVTGDVSSCLANATLYLERTTQHRRWRRSGSIFFDIRLDPIRCPV